MIRKIAIRGIEARYELARTGRRDVLMKALPGGVTRVYAPGWMPLKQLDALVAARWPELERMHGELDRRAAERDLAHPLADGTILRVHGRDVTLRRVESAKAARARLNGDELTVAAPADTPDERVRALIRACLSREALSCVRDRLEHYIPIVGQAPNRVAVRDQNTRWGSCSSKRNLNFNWKLVLAPPECLDYVVVHELCHLIEFSHSPQFWKLVARVMPEYEFWKKWLKEHGGELGV